MSLTTIQNFRNDKSADRESDDSDNDYVTGNYQMIRTDRHLEILFFERRKGL